MIYELDLYRPYWSNFANTKQNSTKFSGMLEEQANRERTSHWSASPIATKYRCGPVNIHGCWSVMSRKHFPQTGQSYLIAHCQNICLDFNNFDPNNEWASYMIQISESHLHRLFQLLSGLNKWMHSVKFDNKL